MQNRTRIFLEYKMREMVKLLLIFKYKRFYIEMNVLIDASSEQGRYWKALFPSIKTYDSVVTSVSAPVHQKQ